MSAILPFPSPHAILKLLISFFLNIFSLQQSIPFLLSLSMCRWNLNLAFQWAFLAFSSGTFPQNPFSYKTIKHCSNFAPSDTSREKRCLLKFAQLFQESIRTVHIQESMSCLWNLYIINMQEREFRNSFANLTVWQCWDLSYSFLFLFHAFPISIAQFYSPS